MERSCQTLGVAAPCALLLAVGCGRNVVMGCQIGSLDYPRVDTRPVEHGFAGLTFILPDRGASIAGEVGFTGTFGRRESDASHLFEAFLGVRKSWIQPVDEEGLVWGGSYAAVGFSYALMRLETWDGSLSDRDGAFGGYLCLGATYVACGSPTSMELRYTFATGIHMLGGTTSADRVMLVVCVGTE